MFQSHTIVPQMMSPNFQNVRFLVSTEFFGIIEKCNILEHENFRLRNHIEEMDKKTEVQKMVKRKQRRTKEKLEFGFKCPYDGCKRKYASDLALNLHMKIKHNGGTKTLREALAKDIMLASQKGEQIPQVFINFPPQFLRDFKKRFFNEK